MARHEWPNGCWVEYRWFWGGFTPKGLDAGQTPFWEFVNKAIYYLRLNWLTCKSTTCFDEGHGC